MKNVMLKCIFLHLVGELFENLGVGIPMYSSLQLLQTSFESQAVPGKVAWFKSIFKS